LSDGITIITIEYALYAKEMSAVVDISYTHWKNAAAGGALKDERPALLEKASEKEWTPKRVTEEAKTIIERLITLMKRPMRTHL
jgi:hypothetical protein